jgi:hypothetical protein
MIHKAKFLIAHVINITMLSLTFTVTFASNYLLRLATIQNVSPAKLCMHFVSLISHTFNHLRLLHLFHYHNNSILNVQIMKLLIL